MPVINGVYLKDFTALPGAVADADIIPIAITGNQIAYRTTVAGIITNARITGKLLTGLSITGGAVVAADTILQAFGKVQNQINGINLALYVPYTGATGAVNLGAYDLTVHSIQIGRGAGSIATNTRVGTSALNANTTGTENTSIGYSTLLNNTIGGSNSVLGYGSMSSNTSGTSNVAIGNTTLALNISGNTNIAIGNQAGNYSHTPTTNNESSSNSIYLGYDTRSSANGNTNEIVIGHQGNGNGSNTVTIGNSSIANNYFTGNVRGGAFIKLGGTSAEFLKADGSVDSVSYGTGSVTSVGLSMPSAFSVASSPITTSGTIAVTGAGLASQYIRGDGALSDFPTTGGGGSSVSYYLNGSVSQGTFVGNTYYEMNKTPVIGAGTDFSIGADGYIAQFITDANDPASLLIPGGNWNVEMYFSASSNGGTPSFYVEVYKYNGTTFTLLGSSSATPEGITNGTAIDIYYTSVGIPETVLTITDRLAIRVYVTHSGRTITLHTEDNHLSEIVTTFSNGLTTLNGLTKQSQYFAVGSTGTDFAIVSSVDTHTFNIPDAGASARGLITTGTQTIAGFKTFSSTIKLTNGTSNGFSLESGTTGFYSSLKAPAGLAADIIVTLPSATGTVALTSDIHSAVTLSAIGATANANGATLTGQVLNLQPADASFGGVVTTGTQTFAGAKTLTSALSGTSATFANTTALTVAAQTTAGFYNGLAASATGSSFFTKTGSLSSSYSSGFGVDGTYSGGLSSINLRAIGTQQGGGYASSMVFILDNDGVQRNHAIFSSDGSTTLYGALSGTSASFSSTNTATAFIPSGATVPTNGMYLSAANTLNFATNTTNRLSISSAGVATFNSSIAATSATFSGLITSTIGVNNYLKASNISTDGLFIENTNNGNTSYYGINNSTGSLFFTGSAAYSTNIGTASARDFHIGTNGAVRLTIASTGGNMYVGADIDSAAISTFISGLNGFAAKVSNNAYFLYSGLDSSAVRTFYVLGTGDVKNTNNSYGAISDVKLKENIKDATPKLDDLLKVKIRNYNLIGDDKKQIGVIAQELEEIFPTMVDELEDFEELEVPQIDKEGNEVLNQEGKIVTTKQRVSKGTATKSVKYSVFVPMLIKSIQEQQVMIQELKAEIDLLKGEPIVPTDNNLE